MIMKELTLSGLASVTRETSTAKTLERVATVHTSGRVETRIRIAMCDGLIAKGACEIRCTIALESAQSQRKTRGAVLTWRIGTCVLQFTIETSEAQWTIAFVLVEAHGHT